MILLLQFLYTTQELNYKLSCQLIMKFSIMNSFCKLVPTSSKNQNSLTFSFSSTNFLPSLTFALTSKIFDSFFCHFLWKKEKIGFHPFKKGLFHLISASFLGNIWFLWDIHQKEDFKITTSQMCFSFLRPKVASLNEKESWDNVIIWLL
jgi:hypothetical protein